MSCSNLVRVPVNIHVKILYHYLKFDRLEQFLIYILPQQNFRNPNYIFFTRVLFLFVFYVNK